MNRKQFLLLVLALVVLGAAGGALLWQNMSDYHASGARIGAKLLPQLAVADVARIELRDAKTRATLIRKEQWWIVEERGGYPADFKAISDLIIKLADLKVVQAETVGESLLPRVELVEPGKGEGTGTQVELKDAAGKTLANVVLGKKVLKKDPGNPLPSAVDGVPAGRYVRVIGVKDKDGDQVVVVSDPLAIAEAHPGRWLDKTFFKIDRIRTLAVSDGGAINWKIARELEWEQWKFAGGGGELSAGAAGAAANALTGLAFNDVAAEAKPETEGKPVTVIAETFDNLVYTLKIAKLKSGSDYLVSVSVAGEPPRERPAEKGEKPEEKERRDKEFIESRQRLELRMAREKALSSWTYIVDAKQLAPLIKPRDQLVARNAPDDRKRQER